MGFSSAFKGLTATDDSSIAIRKVKMKIQKLGLLQRIYLLI